MGELEFEAEFEERFHDALHSAAPDIVARPNISSTAMASSFFGPNNDPVWADPRLDEWVGQDAIDFDLCDTIRSGGIRSGGDAEVVQTIDRDDRPILLIYAPAAAAVHWPTPFKVRALGAGSSDLVAVGALSIAHLSDDIIHAAKALGMTNLEARVSAALVAQGSMRRAAEHCGVTYNTARKTAAEAMHKTGLANQTQLVRKLSELATAVAPPREVAERLLINTFGFSAREARLALLLAEGHNRQQTARIAGLSDAVAKDSFSSIFQILGISKAPEIPRIIMDVFMAALLGNSHRVVVPSLPGSRQPLQLVPRPDGSLIGLSDFGPKDGKPILILHSSLSTRHPFHHLVSALQAEGFRPITIDRPGFGMTDPLPATTDMFATGTEDVKIVFDRLGIANADLITRGGAFAALAINRAHPELVGQVVVINPDLLQQHCSVRKGSLGIVRTGFDRFPERVERIARWMGSQLTPERTALIIRMGVKDIPVDLQSFENEKHLVDYRRSIMIFATGRISGFVQEQRGYSTQKDVEGIPAANHWTIILGDDDPIHNVDEILSVWKTKAPGAKVKHVKGAGRFVELSHVEEVIAALT